MQVVEEFGIKWRERRSISKVYRDKKVKVGVDEEETRSMKFGKGVTQGCFCHPFYLTLRVP